MTRVPAAGWSATVLLIAILPTKAFAEPTSETARTGLATPTSIVRVDASTCPTLGSDRIEQLLRLELTTLVPVVSELPTLDVEFLCTDDRVRITLKDPVTVKVVTREVTLGASADEERTLALAASELFLASWAELLIPRPEDKARASEPGVSAAKRAVEQVVPTRPSPPTVAIDLRAVGRERNVSAPILTFGGAIRVGHAACLQPQIFADVGWETASVRRAAGRIDINAGALGSGARWCVPVGPGELGLSASVAAMYVSLQGVPSAPGFFGAHFDGFTAEASVGIDANITLEKVRLGATVLVGATAPGPGAGVRGESTVWLEGPWAGAALFAGLSL